MTALFHNYDTVSWREGMMGRGINNFLKFLDSSPSPCPSPVKGEGVFLSFYEIINVY
jgi:hypothetical protein